MPGKPKIAARRLTTAALLVALDVIFTRFFSYMVPGSFDRLSLQFLAHGVEGLLLGPVGAGIAAIAGDLVGMLVNSGGMSLYLPLTFSAMLRGVLYGLFLYKKPVAFPRTLLACAVVTLVVDLGLNPFFMSSIYGQAYAVILLAKIPVRLIWAPASAVLLFFVSKSLTKAIPAFRDGL